MCSLQRVFVSLSEVKGTVWLDPSIGSLWEVIYPLLSQAIHRNIYISPRESCDVNTSISPPRIRPFICKAFEGPLNALNVLTLWVCMSQSRLDTENIVVLSLYRERLLVQRLHGVKGHHSGVQVWLPGCGCGPVWGSGMKFWTGASWLRRRWPGECLWMREDSRKEKKKAMDFKWTSGGSLLPSLLFKQTTDAASGDWNGSCPFCRRTFSWKTPN